MYIFLSVLFLPIQLFESLLFRIINFMILVKFIVSFILISQVTRLRLFKPIHFYNMCTYSFISFSSLPLHLFCSRRSFVLFIIDAFISLFLFQLLVRLQVDSLYIGLIKTMSRSRDKMKPFAIFFDD